jgi:hypothetical protein
LINKQRALFASWNAKSDSCCWADAQQHELGNTCPAHHLCSAVGQVKLGLSWK